MLIQEAIKSGRPFKRPGQIYYVQSDGHCLVHVVGGQASPYTFGPTIDDLSVEDLLADDWELEEKRITITLSQLKTALSTSNFYGISPTPSINSLWEMLGGNTNE